MLSREVAHLVTFIARYSRANQMRSKLLAATDAATVGSVARKSPGFLAAGSMTADGPIPAGVTDATNLFLANMAIASRTYNLKTFNAEVTKTGNIVKTTITFTAEIQSMFMGVVGKTKMTMSGTSTAQSTMPLYMDF